MVHQVARSKHQLNGTEADIDDAVAARMRRQAVPYDTSKRLEIHGIQRIPRALYHCEVPTIAAVNGPAIGAGCDLALMCDMRIAATTAVFAESFVKVGIVPGTAAHGSFPAPSVPRGPRRWRSPATPSTARQRWNGASCPA